MDMARLEVSLSPLAVLLVSWRIPWPAPPMLLLTLRVILPTELQIRGMPSASPFAKFQEESLVGEVFCCRRMFIVPLRSLLRGGGGGGHLDILYGGSKLDRVVLLSPIPCVREMRRPRRGTPSKPPPPPPLPYAKGSYR